MNPVKPASRRRSKKMTLLYTVLAILAAIAALYGIVCVLLYFGQASIIYHPDRRMLAYPSDIGLKYEKITVEAEDDERITGWFIPADNARGVVLFCHGNAGNISGRLETIRIVHELRMDLLIFDYRGFGQSTGAPSEEGTYLDAMAMWRHLTEERGIAPERIVVFGRSLGGAVAAWLAERAAPAGLVMESAFTSIPEMGAELYPFFPVRLASRFHYDSLARMPRIQCPVLVVHSREDRLVPFHHGSELFQAVRAEKRFLEIVGSHNDGFLISGIGYLAGLDDFFSLALGNATRPEGQETN